MKSYPLKSFKNKNVGKSKERVVLIENNRFSHYLFLNIKGNLYVLDLICGIKLLNIDLFNKRETNILLCIDKDFRKNNSSVYLYFINEQKQSVDSIELKIHPKIFHSFKIFSTLGKNIVDNLTLNSNIKSCNIVDDFVEKCVTLTYNEITINISNISGTDYALYVALAVITQKLLIYIKRYNLKNQFFRDDFIQYLVYAMLRKRLFTNINKGKLNKIRNKKVI